MLITTAAFAALAMTVPPPSDAAPVPPPEEVAMGRAAFDAAIAQAGLIPLFIACTTQYDNLEATPMVVTICYSKLDDGPDLDSVVFTTSLHEATTFTTYFFRMDGDSEMPFPPTIEQVPAVIPPA